MRAAVHVFVRWVRMVATTCLPIRQAAAMPLAAASACDRTPAIFSTKTACPAPADLRASMEPSEVERWADPLPALLVLMPLEGQPACLWVGVRSESEKERLADWLVAEYRDLVEEALWAADGLLL